MAASVAATWQPERPSSCGRWSIGEGATHSVCCYPLPYEAPLAPFAAGMSGARAAHLVSVKISWITFHYYMPGRGGRSLGPPLLAAPVFCQNRQAKPRLLDG